MSRDRPLDLVHRTIPPEWPSRSALNQILKLAIICVLKRLVIADNLYKLSMFIMDYIESTG